MSIRDEIKDSLDLEQTISLEEASNSRLVKNLTDDSSFAIISACRDKYSKSENFQRTYDLKQDAKKYGFNEFIGRWVEQDPENRVNRASDENSLMIKNISLKDACKLGVKYEQSSIIYKDKDRCVEICTTPFTDWEGNSHKPGDIVREFHIDPDKPLNSEVASKIFSGENEGPASKFIKGKNMKEFQLHEKYFISSWDGFANIKINLSE